ncbi:MAG: DUF3592 domain-containing protein [bacterium]
MILPIFVAISIITLLTVSAGWIYARKKSRPVFPAWSMWLFVLLILLGSVLVVAQLMRLEKAYLQKNWPQATGVIIGSEVTQTRDAWPMVTYEYSIGKKKYSGSSNLKFPGFGGRINRLDAATKAIAKYPPGKKISVYYHPENPEITLLRPGPTWDIFGQFALGITLLVIGFFFLPQYFSKKSRATRNPELSRSHLKRNINGKH